MIQLLVHAFINTYITDDTFSVHILVVSINIYILQALSMLLVSMPNLVCLGRRSSLYPDILLCPTRRASTLLYSRL